MTARACLLLALAACGDDPPRPDAAAPASSCVATFTGDFPDTTTTDNCATLTSSTLAFTLTTNRPEQPFQAMFELGSPPSPGTYTSETVASWMAQMVVYIGNSVCVCNAGNAATPQGNFTLELQAADPPHGSLHLVQYVLAYPGTVCGYGDIENIDVSF